ncbi:MAG: hypothetical protein IKF71_00560 [Bacilli bacterium]|nr:hypothetical protein [Bacilli bacterium]
MIMPDTSKENQNTKVPMTLDDFIGSLAEYQGEYGESKLAGKIIELLKEKPQTKEEINQLKKQMQKALKHLLIFDKKARKIFINRYQVSIDVIVERIHNDWQDKVINNDTQQEHEVIVVEDQEEEKKQNSYIYREIQTN